MLFKKVDVKFGNFNTFNPKNTFLYVSLILVYAILLFLLSGIARSEHTSLVPIWVLSFIAYVGAGFLIPEWRHQNAQWLFLTLILLALLLQTPIWSEDVFRFVWDGQLWRHGMNAYQYTPTQFAAIYPDQTWTVDLLPKLNSADYFSVYPPLKQAFFYLSAQIAGDNIALQVKCLQVFMALSVCLLFAIMQLWAVARPEISSKVYWIVFNPLLLIESVVNVHFEVVQAVFVLSGLYLLCKKKKILWAAIAIAAAVQIKLLPLLLVPLMAMAVEKSQRIKWVLLSGTIIVLSLTPLALMTFNLNFYSSIDLYFRHFEFNASVYYLFRAIIGNLLGYNPIALLGPVLLLIFSVLYLYILYFLHKKDANEKEVLTYFTVVPALYYLLATTVHPWYILFILCLSIFGSFRWVLLWTFLIFFSYLSYSEWGVNEIMPLSLVSYGILFIFAWRAFKVSGKSG
jgi:alpha-1,6-mannosyltransferase